MSAGRIYEPAVMRWRRTLAAWIRGRLVPESATRRRWWWDRLFVPVPKAAFFTDSEEEIRVRLSRAESDSAEVLREAEKLFQEPFDTSDDVERRATTLQGAVTIAASFSLAGAALLLDTSKVHPPGWRAAFAIAYGVVIVSLVACALRALRATSRVLVWEYPDPERVLRRGEHTTAEYQIARAAELLHAAGRNQGNARYKVAQMRAAGHWFSLALAGLLVTAILFVIYILAGPTAPARSDQKTSSSARLSSRGLLLPSGTLSSHPPKAVTPRAQP